MVLLDTCTLLWLVAAPERLSGIAKGLIEGATEAYVSAISAFEIGIKHSRGALDLLLKPMAWYSAALSSHRLIECPVTGTIAVRSTQLPRLHGDPCDRILIATAQEKGWALLTPDPLIGAYANILVRW